MKKLKFLRKMLLVVAGLLVGGVNCTWADTYSGTVTTNAQNRITNNGDGTFTTASNAGNQYALALADLSGIENIGGATSVTLEFDCNIPSGSRWLVGIGDKATRGTSANGSSKSTYNTDGLVMRFGTQDGTYYRVNGSTNNSDAFGVLTHCTFTLDIVNKKYSYTIKNGETTLFSGSNVSTTVTAATVVEFYTWVSSATVTISDVSYSFEYEPASYTYTVNAVDEDENVLRVIDTGNTTDASKTVIYPYAIQYGGFWYTTSATNYGTTVNSLSPTANITYSKDESIVGFYEGEDTSGSADQYSNGAYGTVAAQNKRDRGTSAGTLPPGTYQFVGRLVADGNSGRAITIREGTNDPMASLVSNNTTKTATADFTVYATTGSLYINGANSGTEKTNLSTSFDYVLIKRTGDATVSTTLGTNGYGTFASPYALDLANLPTGLKAYKATSKNGTWIHFDEVTGAVQPNTGLLLEGAASETYNIPVVASGSDISATNMLLVNATGSTFDAESGYTYYGLIKNELEFGIFNPESVAIPANKAYLKIEVGSAARLSISFDEDETTGISTMNNLKHATNNEVYNLNGQRVDKPSKGLYIINGRKVVMK